MFRKNSATPVKHVRATSSRPGTWSSPHDRGLRRLRLKLRREDRRLAAPDPHDRNQDLRGRGGYLGVFDEDKEDAVRGHRF